MPVSPNGACIPPPATALANAAIARAGPERQRSLVIGSQIAEGASASARFHGIGRSFGRIGEVAERSHFVPEPSTRGPQGNFDRLSRSRRKPFQNLQNVIVILQIRRAEIR